MPWAKPTFKGYRKRLEKIVTSIEKLVEMEKAETIKKIEKLKDVMEKANYAKKNRPQTSEARKKLRAKIISERIIENDVD